MTSFPKINPHRAFSAEKTRLAGSQFKGTPEAGAPAKTGEKVGDNYQKPRTFSQDGAKTFYENLRWQTSIKAAQVQDDRSFFEVLGRVETMEKLASDNDDVLSRWGRGSFHKQGIYKNLYDGCMSSFEREYQKNGETPHAQTWLARARNILQVAKVMPDEFQKTVDQIKTNVRAEKLEVAGKYFRNGLQQVYSSNPTERKEAIQQLQDGFKVYAQQYFVKVFSGE